MTLQCTHYNVPITMYPLQRTYHNEPITIKVISLFFSFFIYLWLSIKLIAVLYLLCSRFCPGFAIDLTVLMLVTPSVT
jgi:hypothetical protein